MLMRTHLLLTRLYLSKQQVNARWMIVQKRALGTMVKKQTVRKVFLMVQEYRRSISNSGNWYIWHNSRTVRVCLGMNLHPPSSKSLIFRVWRMVLWEMDRRDRDTIAFPNIKSSIFQRQVYCSLIWKMKQAAKQGTIRQVSSCRAMHLVVNMVRFFTFVRCPSQIDRCFKKKFSMLMFMRMITPLVELLSKEDQNLVPSVFSWSHAKNILIERAVKMRVTQLAYENIFRTLQSDSSRWRLSQMMLLGLGASSTTSLFPKKQAFSDSLRTVIFIITDSKDRIASPMNMMLELWQLKFMNQSKEESLSREYSQKFPISMSELLSLFTPWYQLTLSQGIQLVLNITFMIF